MGKLAFYKLTVRNRNVTFRYKLIALYERHNSNSGVKFGDFIQ